MAAAVACAVVAACRAPAHDVAPPQQEAPPPTARVAAITSAPSAPPASSASSLSSAGATPAPPPVVTDWCIDGLTALDEETCYVLPDARRADGPPPLLVYLHGIVPPTPRSPQKEKVELAVLHAAMRAGAAALVPRGMRGIGPSGAHDWWAWPTEPAAHANYAARLVAKWADARRRLEALAGVAFTRTYLAGSSNGAYFLTTLALRGDLDRLGFPIDGFGAMSGGSAGGRVASSLAARPRPFYVGYGAYDESTKASAHALTELLERAKWPTRSAEHPFGHGAREEYLDEAFAFWSSGAD